jgi:hypothetical protein
VWRGFGMSRAAIIVIAFIVAFVVGTASAGYAVSHWMELAGQRSGPWQRLAIIGQANVDPYTRALEHISKQLQIGGAEGHIYSAGTDSAGQELDAACAYKITGDIPAARLFTLRVETAEGQLIAAKAPLPSAIHSDQMLFSGTQFTINIGSVAQADNWLALQASGPFRFVMTYYDVAVINDDTGNATRLPNIIKGRCADD